MSDRGPYIQTYSGGRAYLLDPHAEDIRIVDIVRGLSHVARFAGQTRCHYSVATHSILVSEICDPDNALVGLLHDAAEAYIGDVVSPLKHVMAGYRELEAKWCAAIDEAFDLKGRLTSLPPDVKHADTKALVIEAHALLVGGPHRWDDELITARHRAETAELEVVLEEPRVARKRFMDRFSSLWHAGVR